MAGPVQYVALTPNEFSTQLTQAGVPEQAVQVATAFSQGIAQGEFDFPSPTLTRLIGREWE